VSAVPKSMSLPGRRRSRMPAPRMPALLQRKRPPPRSLPPSPRLHRRLRTRASWRRRLRRRKRRRSTRGNKTRRQASDRFCGGCSRLSPAGPLIQIPLQTAGFRTVACVRALRPSGDSSPP
jgi:hypothetical protein